MDDSPPADSEPAEPLHRSLNLGWRVLTALGYLMGGYFGLFFLLLLDEFTGRRLLTLIERVSPGGRDQFIAVIRFIYSPLIALVRLFF